MDAQRPADDVLPAVTAGQDEAGQHTEAVPETKDEVVLPKVSSRPPSGDAQRSVQHGAEASKALPVLQAGDAAEVSMTDEGSKGTAELPQAVDVSEPLPAHVGEAAAAPDAAADEAARQAAEEAAEEAAQHAAATKVQASIRGRNARKNGGRGAFSSSQSNALLSTLSGQANREARKKIEKLIKQEGVEADILLVLQRRVVGRKDPVLYLSILQKEDAALQKWYDDMMDRHMNFEAAMVIQRKWLFGSDSVTAALKLSAKLAHSRAILRKELLDILELRDDVRTCAFEFFEQVAPPISKRVKEIKVRLEDLQDKQTRDAAEGKPGARITSTKHPGFTIVRTCQQEMLVLQTKLKAIEKHMVSFATREEMRILKSADGDAGAVSRELLQLKKLAVTPSRGEGRAGWKNMSGKWKAEERRMLLLPSAIGPVRIQAKNALEEIRALREEMDLVVNASNVLQKTRGALAAIRGGKPVNDYEDDEAKEAARKAREEAQQGMQLSVLSIFRTMPGGSRSKLERAPSGKGQGGSSSKNLMTSAAGSKRPPLAPGGSKKHMSTKGRLDDLPDVDFSDRAGIPTLASPLWGCSPSGGWQSNHAMLRPVSRQPQKPAQKSPARLPPTSAQPSSAQPSPALPKLAPGVSLFAGGASRWGGLAKLNSTVPLAVAATGVLPLEAMASADPPSNMTNPVTDAYVQPGSKWNPVRFDYPSASWVTCKKPIEFPEPQTVLRSVRSLPALTKDVYNKPPFEYQPRGESDYLPVRPGSPPKYLSRPDSPQRLAALAREKY